MAKVCPDCSLPLVQKAFHHLMLDVCTSCAGVFFDEGELGDLKNQGLAALEELEYEIVPEGIAVTNVKQVRTCPGCQSFMHEYNFQYTSPVRLDGCDACGGIWVQEGELEAIAEFLRVPEDRLVTNRATCRLIMNEIEISDQDRLVRAEAKRRIVEAISRTLIRS